MEIDTMRRKKMSRKGSKKSFRKNSGVLAKNMVRPMRGGFRI